MARKKKTKDPNQPPNWRYSDAKQYLYELILDDKIPMNYSSTLGPRKVFDLYCRDRPEFKDFGYELFPSRLRTLVLKFGGKTERSDRDDAALAHDRKLFPRPTHNHLGVPLWPETDALKKLQEDMEANLHITMNTRELYDTREEYHKNYKFKSFRRRVYQEIRANKFHSYVKAQREKKELKRQEKA